MAYAVFSHFETYLEQFGTRYYGVYNEIAGTTTIDTVQWQADIDAAFDKINNLLDSVPRIPFVPVGTMSRTGSYNPYLVEWNCVEAIYQRLRSRHAPEFADQLPQWIQDFGKRGQDIYNGIESERYILESDSSSQGIGYPIKVTVTGIGTFHTNWNFGLYHASDYTKEFRFRVTGTLGGNAIGQAVFQVSEDGGASFLPDVHTTGTEWQEIRDGLMVRWQPGVGTNNQLNINDEWKTTCVPSMVRNVGSPVRWKRFERG